MRNPAERHPEHPATGVLALREYEHTSAAYTAAEVERYILAIAKSKKVRHPKPAKAVAKKPPGDVAPESLT